MADLKIGKITMGMCQTNCYFLYREGSSDVIFIDPADSGKYIVEKLKEKGFEIKAILLFESGLLSKYSPKSLISFTN